jgi:hypothetical protein
VVKPAFVAPRNPGTGMRRDPFRAETRHRGVASEMAELDDDQACHPRAGRARSHRSLRKRSRRRPSDLRIVRGERAALQYSRAWIWGRSQVIGAPPEHPGSLLGCSASQGGGCDEPFSNCSS